MNQFKRAGKQIAVGGIPVLVGIEGSPGVAFSKAGMQVEKDVTSRYRRVM